jgi:hypothetical protein
MKGHEYARAQVRAHLLAQVPGRLAALRTVLQVSTPANPATAAYQLADGLPTDPNLYPAVVITSTGAPRITRQSVYAAGDSADFIVVYDLRVVVACRTDTAGGDEAASRDRDRLLLAVREALLAHANLPADVEFFTDQLAEDTGAASQDLRGRPLSAGQVTFSVAVIETLAPIPVPDALVVSDVDVTGYGRDTGTLPTT